MRDGKRCEFHATEKIGQGLFKSIVAGISVHGRQKLESVLAVYHPGKSGLAYTLEAKHRTLQEARVPTYDYCHAVELGDGKTGALLPNLNRGSVRVLSLSDSNEPREETGRVIATAQDRRRIIAQLMNISHRATNVGARVFPDAPFYRLREKNGNYFIQDVLLGDLDDTQLQSKYSHLEKHNSRVLLGNFEDFLDQYSMNQPRLNSWAA